MQYEIKKPFTIKIAILYIADKYKDPISDSILTQIALDKCAINYFTLKQCLYELTSNEFVESHVSDNVEYHIITEKGRQSLDFFVTKLPYALRHTLNNYIQNIRIVRDQRNAFVCEAVQASENDYNVRCAYMDETSTTFELNFRAGDLEQAQLLVEKLTNKQDLIYSDIYNYIIHITQPSQHTILQEANYEDIEDINFFGENK